MDSSSSSSANSRIFLCFLLLLWILAVPSLSLDFLFNSFSPADLILVNDTSVSSAAVVLTNNSDQFSIGRAFYPAQLPIDINATTNTVATSFSTSFIFSVLPDDPTTPGFGLAFVLSNTTAPPNALSGQYFGLFSNATLRVPYPLLAVEFDTGRNPEFGDPDGNHVGIDLNFIESSVTHTAGYYLDNGEFRAIGMRTGLNVRAWVEFDGPNSRILVTVAPANVTNKPRRPLINYTDAEIVRYLSPRMYVGFSASKVTWVEEQRILRWSFSDTGPARDLNTTGLPVFEIRQEPSSDSSSSFSSGAIAGLVVASVALLALLAVAVFLHRRRRIFRRWALVAEKEEVEEWEMEFWPRRFKYLDLYDATRGFSGENLIGYGGFGKVFKGILPGGGDEVAVKCVSHESKQGVREFMAEISSMGRLQHRRLIRMRGWCRRGKELMLVYDYMPNGSLCGWIFPKHERDRTSASASATTVLMGWAGRKRVLLDVAEGLLHLHEGWEKVVLHRDVKPSNILLDGDMRGRIGDFGLAKLYGHGEVVGTTRVVGTLGYLAPELARVAAPTKKSDVYSYGVVVLEACSGRRAIELGKGTDDDDFVLVDWAREMYVQGKVREVAEASACGGGEEEELAEMELVFKLGLACCHPDPELRPAMKDVVGVLMGLKMDQLGT